MAHLKVDLNKRSAEFEGIFFVADDGTETQLDVLVQDLKYEIGHDGNPILQVRFFGRMEAGVVVTIDPIQDPASAATFSRPSRFVPSLGTETLPDTK